MGPMTEPDYRTINHANWESRVAVHAASAAYRLDRYVDEPDLISETVDFDRAATR